jgi:hypothetical protein
MIAPTGRLIPALRGKRSSGSEVSIWGASPTPISFGAYKLLTFWLVILVGISWIAIMSVTRGNPFKWPGEG